MLKYLKYYIPAVTGILFIIFIININRNLIFNFYFS